MRPLLKDVSPSLVDVFIPDPSLFIKILQKTKIGTLIVERTFYEKALLSFDRFHGKTISDFMNLEKDAQVSNLECFIRKRVVEVFSLSRSSKILKQIDANILTSAYFERILRNTPLFPFKWPVLTKVRNLDWLAWYENNRLMNFPDGFPPKIMRELSRLLTSPDELFSTGWVLSTENVKMRVDLKDTRCCTPTENQLSFCYLSRWFKTLFDKNIQTYKLSPKYQITRLMNGNDPDKPSFICWGGNYLQKTAGWCNLKTQIFESLFLNVFFESDARERSSVLFFDYRDVFSRVLRVDQIPKEEMDWEKWSFGDIFPVFLGFNSRPVGYQEMTTNPVGEELRKETRYALSNPERLETIYLRRMSLLSSMLYVKSEKVMQKNDDADYLNVLDAVNKMTRYLLSPSLDTKIIDPEERFVDLNKLKIIAEKCVLTSLGIGISSDEMDCSEEYNTCFKDAPGNDLCSGIHKDSPLFVFYDHCKVN